MGGQGLPTSTGSAPQPVPHSPWQSKSPSLDGCPLQVRVPDQGAPPLKQPNGRGWGRGRERGGGCIRTPMAMDDGRAHRPRPLVAATPRPLPHTTGGPPIPGPGPPPGTPDCCRGPLPTPGSQTPGPRVLALPEPSVMEATTMPTSLTQASPLGTGPSPSSPPACHPTLHSVPPSRSADWALEPGQV